MATSTVLSTGQTNRDASPRVINNAGGYGGSVKVMLGQCEIAAGDVSPSTYNFGQIPSHAVVFSCMLRFNGVGGTTSSMHLGVWSTTANGGGVVDNDFFATALTLASALAGTELVHEAAVASLSAINGLEKPLWQRLGLSVDPGVMYDVKGILSGAYDNTSTINTLGLTILYGV